MIHLCLRGPNVKTMKLFIYGLCLLLWQPAISAADIAYLKLTDGVWQVWMMQDDGANARQVTHGRADKTRISWYPDGHLFVNTVEGRVYRLAADTGDKSWVETELSGYQDAVLSPDGRYFTFSLSPGGSRDANDIWVVDSDGGNPRKMTTLTHLQHEPAWSPDSRYVYFLSGDGGRHHDIWRVAVDGPRAEQITAESLFHFDIAIAPDGTLVSSNNRAGQYDLWLRGPDGEEHRLTDHPGLDARPSWSPDGTELVFESTRSGALNIWKIARDGGEPVQLTHTDEGARFPVWRTNGGGQ